MVAFMADRQKTSSRQPGNVKRATSIPNVRAVVDVEDDDLSSADKKRNKLGYHRTAVACGHCRRRKIRCIPSADPNSTRCQNCIRLKKDCQFYPVDQSVTPQPKRTRSDSRGDTLTAESETSVSSSSPRIHTGVSGVDHYDRFRSIPMDGNAVSHENDYHPHYDQRQWYSSEPSPHTYWLQHDPNNTNSFASPYSTTPTSTGPPVAAHEHSYTYPTVSVDHPGYMYMTHGAHEGHTNPQPNANPSYGGYRANTLPEKMEITDERYRVHDMHDTATGMQPRNIMGPPIQPNHGPPQSYILPSTQQMWMPIGSEQHHHHQHDPYSTASGHLPTWFNHSEEFGHAGKKKIPPSHAQDTVPGDSNQFRPKPG